MTNTSVSGVKRPYTSPKVTQLGTVHELTLQTNKALGGNDGFTFEGQPVHFTSP
jgi:hypothetical protein